MSAIVKPVELMTEEELIAYAMQQSLELAEPTPTSLPAPNTSSNVNSNNVNPKQQSENTAMANLPPKKPVSGKLKADRIKALEGHPCFKKNIQNEDIKSYIEEVFKVDDAGQPICPYLNNTSPKSDKNGFNQRPFTIYPNEALKSHGAFYVVSILFYSYEMNVIEGAGAQKNQPLYDTQLKRLLNTELLFEVTDEGFRFCGMHEGKPVPSNNECFNTFDAMIKESLEDHFQALIDRKLARELIKINLPADSETAVSLAKFIITQSSFASHIRAEEKRKREEEEVRQELALAQARARGLANQHFSGMGNASLHALTGGLSEEEQLARALAESEQQSTGRPAANPAPSSLGTRERKVNAETGQLVLPDAAPKDGPKKEAAKGEAPKSGNPKQESPRDASRIIPAPLLPLNKKIELETQRLSKLSAQIEVLERAFSNEQNQINVLTAISPEESQLEKIHQEFKNKVKKYEEEVASLGEDTVQKDRELAESRLLDAKQELKSFFDDNMASFQRRREILQLRLQQKRDGIDALYQELTTGMEQLERLRIIDEAERNAELAIKAATQNDKAKTSVVQASQGVASSNASNAPGTSNTGGKTDDKKKKEEAHTKAQNKPKSNQDALDQSLYSYNGPGSSTLTFSHNGQSFASNGNVPITAPNSPELGAQLQRVQSFAPNRVSVTAPNIPGSGAPSQQDESNNNNGNSKRFNG